MRNPAQGVVLTAAGKRLMAEVREIIDRTEQLYVTANELSSTVQGPLSIGCLVTAAPVILPNLMAPFQTAHPSVQLSFADLDQSEIIINLRRAQIDLAITYDMHLPKDVRFTKLAELPPHVVVPADHPLARQDVVSIEEVARHPYVLLDLPISRDYFLSLFERGNSQPKVVHSSRSFEIVQSMVAIGYGVTISAIAPRRDSAMNGYPLTTVPLTADVPNLPLGLAVLDRGADTPASKAFQTYCTECFSKRGPNLRTPDGT